VAVRLWLADLQGRLPLPGSASGIYQRLDPAFLARLFATLTLRAALKGVTFAALGSHDHRGTPDKPGRVVTLIEAPGTVCAGMAYRITPDVFEHLDHREKNGYLRVTTPLTFADGQHEQGLVYIATADNAAFLGEASEQQIADHIAASHGPSGSNAEYLLQLAEALRQLDVIDEHVFHIEHYLLRASD